MKYERNYPTVETEKVFNDILEIRMVVDDYSIVDNLIVPDSVEIADMRNGKAKDDGYRGIHIYYQKDHYHYPIEIQFVTSRDRQFNEWIHIFLYKYISDNTIGVRLRELYDNGIIKSEEDFRKEMRKICAI